MDVTEHEMGVFLISICFMDFCHCASHRDYWTKGLLGNRFLQMLFTRKRFEKIKHCLMVANPSEEENKEDKCSKFRAFHNQIWKIIQSRWMPGPCQCLDESQQQCGNRRERVSHRGERHKPLSDFLNFISAHECNCAYCFAFIIDERDREKTVIDLILDVLLHLYKEPVLRMGKIKW